MNLVVIFLRTLIETEQQANDGDQIRKGQLPETLRKADDKGHDQEVREEEQVFPRFYSFHIIHDRQVEVQVQHRQEPGEEKMPPQVEMIGYDKDIGRAKIDQRTDVKPETEIGDDTDEMRDEDEEDELVEPDRLLRLGSRIVIPEPGIDYIFIERSKYIGDRVTHRTSN